MDYVRTISHRSNKNISRCLQDATALMTYKNMRGLEGCGPKGHSWECLFGQQGQGGPKGRLLYCIFPRVLAHWHKHRSVNHKQHSGKKTSLKPVQTKIIINLPERIKLWLERMLPNKHCYQCVMQGMKISSKCYWESVILNRIAFYTKDIKAVQRHILPAKMSSCPKPLLKFWKCLPK